MKNFIITVSGGLLIAVLLQSFTIMPANKTEEQRHTIVRKYNDFEIRFYPTWPLQVFGI